MLYRPIFLNFIFHFSNLLMFILSLNMWMQMPQPPALRSLKIHQLQSSEASQGDSCDFLTLSVTRAVVPAVRKQRGPKQWVWWETRHSDWCSPNDWCSPSVGLLPLTPILQARTLTHLFTLLSDLKPKRGREEKKRKKETPTISSIFLMNPIFCLRAQGAFVRPWQL